MKKTYLIINMKCAGCAKNITEALNQLVGITNVEVDIPGKNVEVTFNEEEVNTEIIENTLKAVGYPVA